MRRVGRDEAEAAYFTLLRAREELDALHRYGEYLSRDRLRLHRLVAEGDALDAHVSPRLRRALRHTDEPLAEAVRTRLAVLADEEARQADRIAAAEAFVEDCEAELARLRGGGAG